MRLLFCQGEERNRQRKDGDGYGNPVLDAGYSVFSALNFVAMNKAGMRVGFISGSILQKLGCILLLNF